MNTIMEVNIARGLINEVIKLLIECKDNEIHNILEIWDFQPKMQIQGITSDGALKLKLKLFG